MTKCSFAALHAAIASRDHSRQASSAHPRNPHIFLLTRCPGKGKLDCLIWEITKRKGQDSGRPAFEKVWPGIDRPWFVIQLGTIKFHWALTVPNHWPTLAPFGAIWHHFSPERSHAGMHTCTSRMQEGERWRRDRPKRWWCVLRATSAATSTADSSGMGSKYVSIQKASAARKSHRCWN